MTKQMEGDGPQLPMVMYEYVRVLENLRKRKEAAKSTVLEPTLKQIQYLPCITPCI
jgi:hypothetical protein